MSAPLAKPRVGFVDAARVLAMYSMVQGHVADTLLSAEAKASELFTLYWNVRGVTAPLFFALSGISFVLASESKFGEFGKRGPLLVGHLKRALTLVVVATFLQMPRWYGRPPFDFTGEEWRYVMRVGVLHCIAWALVLTHALAALSRSKRAFTCAALVAGIAVVAATPALAGSAPHDVPLPVGMLVRTSDGSLFPLFPWLAHFLFGAVLGRLLLDWRRLDARLPRAGFLLAVGALLALAGGYWRSLEPHRPTLPLYWVSDPTLFLTRAGLAWMAMGGISLLWGTGTSPRWIRDVSAQSLTIYVVHLVVLYGAPGQLGLIHAMDGGLPLWAGFVAGPLVLGYTAALSVLVPRGVEQVKAYAAAWRAGQTAAGR